MSSQCALLGYCIRTYMFETNESLACLYSICVTHRSIVRSQIYHICKHAFRPAGRPDLCCACYLASYCRMYACMLRTYPRTDSTDPSSGTASTHASFIYGSYVYLLLTSDIPNLTSSIITLGILI